MNILYKEYEGNGAYVTSLADAEYADYAAYGEKIKNEGYSFIENHMFGANYFATYAKGNDAVYLAYYPSIREMRIVEEKDSAYITYADEKGIKSTQSAIVQLDLQDCGMSYMIRLDDGRLIVIDGGCKFEPDADNLMNVMDEMSEGKRPRIAAWIMTHPHSDHYRCFLPFHEKYADRIDIEKFIYNFPDLDERNSVPWLDKDGEAEHMQLFYKYEAETGAKVYKAHTGQIYNVGNARFEVLSSFDDCFFAPVNDVNPISLILKMTLEGQTVLWSADAYYKPNKLAARYGEYLKCDMLQVPHHGFGGGESDIEEFKLIDPKVCLYPCEERNTYECIDIYFKWNQFLFYDMNVDEVITCSNGNIVLPMPYTPCSNSRKLYLDKIYETQKSIGAKSWYFMELTPETADFTIINATPYPIEVYIDLFFDEPTDLVKDIKIMPKGRSVTKINITDLNAVDGNALFFNRRALSKVGIPEGKKFAAHFKCKYPLVIKGRNKPEYSW